MYVCMYVCMYKANDVMKICKQASGTYIQQWSENVQYPFYGVVAVKCISDWNMFCGHKNKTPFYNPLLFFIEEAIMKYFVASAAVCVFFFLCLSLEVPLKIWTF
jgi:hypothetical protein